MKKISFILFLFILLRCNNHPTSNELDSFFYELERKIDNEEIIQKFKNAPREAVINSSIDFTDEFSQVYENPQM